MDKTYEKYGYKVTAPSESSADRVANLLDLQDGPTRRRLVILDNEGLTHLVKFLNDRSYEVYYCDGKEVKFAGKVEGGRGYKLIQSAVDSLERNKERANKLAQVSRRQGIQRRHSDVDKVIADFESTIPGDIRAVLYEDVMLTIADTKAYKIEIIDKLSEKGIAIKPHNWEPLLTWFRNHVLMHESALDRTQYQLRAAFVTAAARMVGDNVRGSNTLRLIKVEDDFDWEKYAEEQKGS